MYLIFCHVALRGIQPLMLAHSIIRLFLSKEWRPYSANRGDIIRAWLPINNKGHHLLAILSSPLVNIYATSCCMRCCTVVDPVPVLYGKLFMYCPACLQQEPDKIRCYFNPMEMRDYLLFFLHKNYNVYEAEAIICQAIELNQTFKARCDRVVQLLDSIESSGT